MNVKNPLENDYNKLILNYMKTILKDVSARLPYLSPECDIFSIKTEGIICTSDFEGDSIDPGDPFNFGNFEFFPF